MSQTITSKLEPITVRELLRTYEVHQTGQDRVTSSTESTTNPHVIASLLPSPPPNWLSDYRRIPSYRAINSTHTYSSRPGGDSYFEGVLVVTMFTGVYVIAVSKITLSFEITLRWREMSWLINTLQAINRVWRGTVGQFKNKIMRYEVGGEW
jgi:hypothetical protein